MADGRHQRQAGRTTREMVISNFMARVSARRTTAEQQDDGIMENQVKGGGFHERAGRVTPHVAATRDRKQG